MSYKLPVDYTKLNFKQRKEVRQQYIIEQNNLCMFCKCSLDEPPPKEITDKPINWSLFPPNFLKYPIHLQHSHVSGLTEGAAHSHCNAHAWYYYGK